MYQLQLLCQYNIFAYASFLLYMLLRFSSTNIIMQIIMIFVLAFSLFLTSNTLRLIKDKCLANIKLYCITDCVVRILGLLLCIAGKLFGQSKLAITLQIAVLITLFACNLTVEKIMSIRIQRYIKKDIHVGSEEKRKQPIVISIGVSYMETIYLFYMLLLPFNMHSGMRVGYYIVWMCVLLCLLMLYIRQTLRTLYHFYKKEKEVRHTVITENSSILLLLAGLSLYGYYYGFVTFADGLFYLTSLLLLLPRQFSRMKRLAMLNERMENEYGKVGKSKA